MRGAETERTRREESRAEKIGGKAEEQRHRQLRQEGQNGKVIQKREPETELTTTSKKI